MAKMLAEFGPQRRLQHLPGQPGQQPTRTSQLDTPRSGRRDQLLSQRRQIRLDRTLG
jgi:hypothetical protein